MGSQIAEKACRYIHVYEVGLKKKDDTWLFYPHLSIFDPSNYFPLAWMHFIRRSTHFWKHLSRVSIETPTLY